MLYINKDYFDGQADLSLCQSCTPLTPFLHFATYKAPITHCLLVDSSTVVCWTSLLVILGVLSLFCHFYSILDGKSS